MNNVWPLPQYCYTILCYKYTSRLCETYQTVFFICPLSSRLARAAKVWNVVVLPCFGQKKKSRQQVQDYFYIKPSLQTLTSTTLEFG